MSGKVYNKIYYKIELSVESPLAIGSGKSISTDQDIIKDRRGVPYIPATALAGVYRTLFSEADQKKYFGYVMIDGKEENKDKTENDTEKDGEQIDSGRKNKEKERQRSSEIITYDANINGNFQISQRDGVKLDEWKTAKEGSKFNFEVLETKGSLITYLEITTQSEDEQLEKAAEKIIAFMQSGNMYVGARTTRGYGNVKAKSVWKIKFCLKGDNKQSKNQKQNVNKTIEKWLKFDIYDDKTWIGKKEIKELTDLSYNKAPLTISLDLKQVGGIFIRRYTTDPKISTDKEGSNSDKQEIGIDSEQLTLHDKDHTPVIPGSSWAGAFYHHLEKLAMDYELYGKQENGLNWFSNREEIKKYLKKWFGLVDKNTKERKKSLLVFQETTLNGTKEKVVIRNAIDRFSGGTVDGALFKEKFCINGSGTLNIIFRKCVTQEEELKFFKLLAAAIMDLHNGFMAIGGGTAVGRGLFKIQSVKIGNEAVFKIEGDESYWKICKILEEQWNERINIANERTVNVNGQSMD